MYNRELYDQTRKLLRDLKYFMIHVLIYVPLNILLVLFTLKDMENHWWGFFPMVLWATLLVYHSLQLFAEREEKRLKALSI